MSRLRTAAIALGVVSFFGIGLWQTCFQVTNEFGPVGADKAGRQIMIQSLHAYLDRTNDSVASGWAVDVESEFLRVPLVVRLLQEPMRTTLRLSYRVLDRSQSVDSTLGQRFLSSPAAEITSLYRGPVSMRENLDVSPDTVVGRLASLGVGSVAQLLAAFGFRRFQLVVDGTIVFQDTLPTIGRGNSQLAGAP